MRGVLRSTIRTHLFWPSYFDAPWRSIVMGDWRRYFGSVIIVVVRGSFTSVTPAVALDARYGLAAVEKSLAAGE